MKKAPKVTFKGNIGFDAVTKVYYKNVYYGRIIFNKSGLMEFHEKNESFFHKHNIVDPEFDDKDKVKNYVINRILIREKRNKENIKFISEDLTDLGKSFLRKFYQNNIIYRKEFSKEHKAVADMFVIQGILEKGDIDNNVVYYTKKEVYNQLSKF